METFTYTLTLASLLTAGVAQAGYKTVPVSDEIVPAQAILNLDEMECSEVDMWGQSALGFNIKVGTQALRVHKVFEGACDGELDSLHGLSTTEIADITARIETTDTFDWGNPKGTDRKRKFCKHTRTKRIHIVENIDFPFEGYQGRHEERLPDVSYEECIKLYSGLKS